MSSFKEQQRYFRLKLIDFLVSLKRRNQSFELENAKSIVFIRWDGKLGDSVIAALFVKAIRQYRPDIKVTVLTNRLAKAWMEKVVDADYIEVEKRASKIKKQLSPLQGKFDVAIEMSTKLNNRNFYALSTLDAKVNISFGKQAFRLFDMNVDSKIFLQRYKELSRLFVGDEQELSIPVPDYSQAEIDAGFSHGEKIVAVNLWGAAKERSFSLNSAEELLNRLSSELPNHTIALIPVPGKSDFLNALVTKIKGLNVVLPTVEPSLENTLQLLSLSELVITPDTSVVHMASALDRKVLAIYPNDANNFEEWRPFSSEYEVEFVRADKMPDVALELVDFDFDAFIEKAIKLAAQFD